MIRERIVDSIQELAGSLDTAIDGTEWHLFGSVDRNEPGASDIDLMILCKSNKQADELRRVIDPVTLGLPLHLTLMTFDEAAEVDAIRVQRSSIIFSGTNTAGSLSGVRSTSPSECQNTLPHPIYGRAE